MFLKQNNNDDNKLQKEKMVEDEVKYKEALSRIILFPGSIEEFKKFRGYSSVRVIDTMREDKGFALAKDKIKGVYAPNEELGKYMVDNGIEAIVNVNDTLSPSQSATIRLVYGLPVRKCLRGHPFWPSFFGL